jgi:hypothetical protein
MEDQNKDYTKAIVKKLIDTDPLLEAEKLTGKSYKNDKSTSMLGLAIQMEKSKKVNEILTSLDDTKFSNTEPDYIRKITDFGFESALVIPFINDKGVTERLHVFFHPRLSILLVFDTFTWDDDGSWAKAGKSVPPPSVNGGKFYYNWSPKQHLKNRGEFTSSGGFISKREDRFCTMYDENFNVIDQSNLDLPEELDVSKHGWDAVKERDKEIHEALGKIPHRKVWVGDHDCREAVKMNITNMIDNGTFLTKWKERPFMWLLHYMDTKVEGYDYKQIIEDRIAMLPDHVREAITPNSAK